MKVAIFHKPGQPLSIEDRPVPTPGPGQILLRVERCGICGSDLTMTDKCSPISFAEGCVPGHEFAGEVVAIGMALDCVAPRGTVVSSGMCFSEEHFIPGFAVMKQPRLQFSMACTVGDFHSAVAALEAGDVEPRAMISRTITLAALPQTLEAMRQRSDDCKILVRPAS